MSSGRRRRWAVIRTETGEKIGLVRCTLHRSSYEEIEEDDSLFSGETASAVLGRGGEKLRRGMLLETEGRVYTVQNVNPGIGRTSTVKLRRFVFHGEA